MTELLEKAFTEASRLPLAMQDTIAERLLEDIDAEEKWDDSFAGSQDEPARLADENEKFWKAFENLPAQIQRRACEAYRLWQENPFHPSLQFKQIHSAKPIFSVRVGTIYWSKPIHVFWQNGRAAHASRARSKLINGGALI